MLTLVLVVATSNIRSAQIQVGSLITQAINDRIRVTLRGNVSPLARPAFDHGPAPASLPMQRMLLVLKRSPAQKKALNNLLEEQQEKSSPNFHHWLSPTQFGREFGPSEQDIQTVVSWLQSYGFQIDSVSKGRTVIEFSGTAEQVQAALHTGIHRYVVKRKSYWANNSDPQIPAALAPAVAGIASLNNFPLKPMHVAVGVLKKAVGARKFRFSPAQSSPLDTLGTGCGLESACYMVGPWDFATIYNVRPLWNSSPAINGTGETIAIPGRSDIYAATDIVNFRSFFGLPPISLNIIHNGPDPADFPPSSPGYAGGGDLVESELDVEWSGAVAPGATIDLVVSASTNSTDGIDLSSQYIVDNDLAPIMSVSYSGCELQLGAAGNQFYNQLWQQAAAEGMTVFVASGDSGSAACDQSPMNEGASGGLAVNGLASTPYDIAVGGTDFNDLNDPGTYWNTAITTSAPFLGTAKSYIPEMTWNQTCTNSEFFLLDGATSAEVDCNEFTSSYMPGFLYPVGAGGGASNCTAPTGTTASTCAGGYPKPAWQTGPGVPNDGKRDLPDVSMFASDAFNGSAYEVCAPAGEMEFGPQDDQQCNPSQGFIIVSYIGGTSVSAQVLAGAMALVDQKTQSRQGDANYVLYPLAAQPGVRCDSSAASAGSCIFYDVTLGTISMPCVTGSPNCVSSSIGATYGVLSGYNATAGYDLATGLGSVNVANLVNNWTDVTFQPTITSLKLNNGNAVDITHGSPVNVSVSVTSKTGTGTPTGLVSLLASSGQNAGVFTLANGAVSGVTASLPGGSYTVTAHYAGDGTYGASDSSPGVAVTVNPEPSTTSLQIFTLDSSGNVTPFTGGSYAASAVYLRAAVAGQSGKGVATGTVNFVQTLNGVSSDLTGDPYSLNSEGHATILPSAFPPGTYSLAANYGGDPSFNPSASARVSFTITKAPTNLFTYVYENNGPVLCQGTGACRIGLGENDTLSVGIVSSIQYGDLKLNAPTGTLTVFDNGTQMGSPITVNNSFGDFGISTEQLPLGQNNITIQYSGDSNYVASKSSLTFQVEIPTTLKLSASSPTINYGQSVTLTAAVTPSQNGSAAPTGTVTFTLNTPGDLGEATVSGNGQAQLTVSSLTMGTDAISAAYSGDNTYLNSSANLTERVAGFTLQANSSAIDIPRPGQSGSTKLTITAVDGFTGSATLTPSLCSNLPFGTSCSFTPATVSLTSSTSSIPVMLTVATTGSGSLPPFGPRGRLPLWAAAFALLALGLWIVLRRTRPRKRWKTNLALSVFAILALSIAFGCGGGHPGTPTGSTPFTVTVRINGVTQTTDLFLNVK